MPRTGLALLEALLSGQDVRTDLLSAIWDHVQTGASLDAILGLHGQQGQNAPRRQALLQARATAMLRAWAHIRDEQGLTDRQAAFKLHELLTAESIPDPQLERDIIEIRTFGEYLGLNISSPETMYKALINTAYRYHELRMNTAQEHGS